MFSLLQRLNVVTAFMTSVVSILLLAIAATNLSFPDPECKIDVKNLEMYVARLTQRLRQGAVARRPPHAGLCRDVAGPLDRRHAAI